jgi:hypothetical protein
MAELKNTTVEAATPATTSRAYNGAKADVKKVRDFVAGEIAAYVEQLPGHDAATYARFQKCAYFLSAVSRTVDAYVGMIMTPEPIVSDLPESMKPYMDDLTADGEPFRRVTFRACSEVVTASRQTLLIDYPAVSEEDQNLTVLDAERKGLRPFVRSYSFEETIFWRTRPVKGRTVLSHLRLRETEEKDGSNEWQTEIVQKIRVLDLDENDEYRVRVYSEIDGAWVLDAGFPIWPKIKGARLDYIPAVLIGPSSLDPNLIEKPPLLEMCDASEKHLNDSALRQWALKWCGNPQPYIKGLMDDPEDETPIKWGSSNALILSENGDAGLVTMEGEGLGALKDAMEEKRRDMAAIGARILADESGAQISTETARIQRAGEHSVLAGIANTVADGMTWVLRELAKWAGIEGEKIAVTLNTDFVPKGMQPGELKEWMAAIQANQIPLSVALEYFKSRGVVDPEITVQAWRDALAEDVLAAPDLGAEDQPVDEEIDPETGEPIRQAA